jgi:hypothetical protein
VPDAPDRPGKHRARHKAPSRASRLAQRLHPPTISVPSRALRRHGSTLAALGGVAIAATAVSGSTFGSEHVERVTASVGRESWAGAADLTTERTESLSRASRDSVREQISELRTESDDDGRGGGVGAAPQLMPEDPREIAMYLLPEFGWDESQFGCLDDLWVGESDWDVSAENPTSGAYGIPQALPAEKMASAGPDWETNPATQISWGLGYIQDVYGDPCAANDFKTANNWY